MTGPVNSWRQPKAFMMMFKLALVTYNLYCGLIDGHKCLAVCNIHFTFKCFLSLSDKPVLGDWQSSFRWCRKNEVVLCRARIGHTHLTHSYILRKDPPPLCEHCRCIPTVRHILVECNHFARERKDIFRRRDVMESFRFYPTLIVLFLKQIEFYYKF